MFTNSRDVLGATFIIGMAVFVAAYVDSLEDDSDSDEDEKEADKWDTK